MTLKNFNQYSKEYSIHWKSNHIKAKQWETVAKELIFQQFLKDQSFACIEILEENRALMDSWKL